MSQLKKEEVNKTSGRLPEGRRTYVSPEKLG
jgi:hypothetical protein